jgi:hypothetical protein
MPDGTDSPHSMGWRWYRQISFKVSTFIETPRLYDLQLCVVRGEFIFHLLYPYQDLAYGHVSPSFNDRGIWLDYAGSCNASRPSKIECL